MQRIGIPGRTMLLLFLYMFSMFISQSKGECIQPVTSSNSSELKILNNLQEANCMTLNRKSNVRKPEITKLQVNKTCINGSDVTVMAFLSGHHECSKKKILFVNEENSDCSMEIRCKTEKGIPYGSNDTICLLKCPKVETSENTYGLEIISGIQPQNLCGLQIYQVDWIEPNGWTGPDPALYWSFDTPEHLSLMEGTQESKFATLVSGKINSAVSTDKTKRQWIDLGTHTEACMTQPETCGAAGGAISMWMKLVDHCLNVEGLLTGSGSSMLCYFTSGQNYLRFRVVLANEVYATNIASPSGWTHVVINYIGTEHGQEIRIYYDGAQTESVTTSGSASPSGDRYIVIGRMHRDRDGLYASVQLDELIFFNTTLTESEITMLSQF